MNLQSRGAYAVMQDLFQHKLRCFWISVYSYLDFNKVVGNILLLWYGVSAWFVLTDFKAQDHSVNVTKNAELCTTDNDRRGLRL